MGALAILTAVEWSAAELLAEPQREGRQTHGAMPVGVGLSLTDPGVDQLYEHCV